MRAPGKSIAEKLFELFAGYERAHGTHGVPYQEPGNTKWLIRKVAKTVRKPASRCACGAFRRMPCMARRRSTCRRPPRTGGCDNAHSQFPVSRGYVGYTNAGTPGTKTTRHNATMDKTA